MWLSTASWVAMQLCTAGLKYSFTNIIIIKASHIQAVWLHGYPAGCSCIAIQLFVRMCTASIMGILVRLLGNAAVWDQI